MDYFGQVSGFKQDLDKYYKAIQELSIDTKKLYFGFVLSELQSKKKQDSL